MVEPTSPGALTEAWRALVGRIKAGEPALGERLYLLGAGPVPVAGAVGGALTLGDDGGVVLVVGLTEPWQAAAHEIGRQLEGIERLPGAKLREAGVDPDEGGGLANRHASFFGLDRPLAELNSSQRCIIVVPEDKAAESAALTREQLGGRLQAVYVASAAGLTLLGGTVTTEAATEAEPEADAEEDVLLEEEPEAETEAEEEEVPEPEADQEAPAGDEAPEAEGPAEIEVALDEAGDAEEETPEETGVVTAIVEGATGQPVEAVEAYLADESDTLITEEQDAPEKTGVASWPIGNWIGLAMVLMGIVLAAIGVKSLMNGATADPEPPSADPNALIRTVATDVPPDATHARWIGQQRVVTLSDGTLAFAYATPESLNVVKDEADAGETWGEPFVLTDVQPVSLSVDVDSKDRLHVAFSDGTSINYVRLKNKPAGWKPSRVIQLDDDSTSLNVDVAWDEQNQTAHVVWVQQSDDGEAPAWAALTNAEGIHVTEEGILAPPATDVSVLVSVAADGRSSLLVAYRRGDQTTGWSTRYSGSRDADGTWLFDEEEALPLSAFAGAVDVIYDRQKTAHLVLRDSTNYALVYYSKKEGDAWSQGDVAVEGAQVSGVEFPVLSSSAGDGLIYLFFQTDEHDPAGEVAYAVRDTTGEWSDAFDIVSEADAPEGAQYPVAPDRVEDQALVFWTRTGDPYRVDTAPVQAP